jgi:hypothetical protein
LAGDGWLALGTGKSEIQGSLPFTKLERQDDECFSEAEKDGYIIQHCYVSGRLARNWIKDQNVWQCNF